MKATLNIPLNWFSVVNLLRPGEWIKPVKLDLNWLAILLPLLSSILFYFWPGSWPAGIPTSSAREARARADRGVSSDGLMTQVHPAARAAPTLRVIIALGKFLKQNMLSFLGSISQVKSLLLLVNKIEGAQRGERFMNI